MFRASRLAAALRSLWKYKVNDDDFTLLGPDGMPEGSADIALLTARALKVAGRLAIASSDADEVARILSEEVRPADLPLPLRAGFASLVLQELILELFGPLLTILQVEHLDTDFIAQLQLRSGNTRAAQADDTGDSLPESEA